MPAIEQQTVSLHGELLSFRSVTGDGWGYGEVRDPKVEPLPIPVTGKLVGVRPGDVVDVVGVWAEHPKFGRQLKVRTCTVARIEGTDGAVKWIASRIPWVGEHRAAKLVAMFGDHLWDIIENHTARLCEVDGVTPERAEQMRAAYLRYKDEREGMIVLRGWGLTDGQIARCVKQWGTLGAIIDELKKNPYLLAQDVYGFGFVRADMVAAKMGVAADSPERIAAGLEHVLDEASAQGGHCYLAGAALQRVTAELLKVNPALVAKAIRAAANDGRIVLRDWRIYSKRLDIAEQACADALRKMLERKENAA